MTQPSNIRRAGLCWRMAWAGTPQLPGWPVWRSLLFGPPAAPVDPSDGFGQALQALADGDWHQAYIQLADLADGGHDEARRLALQLASNGQRLFGLRCALPPQRRARWAALAWSAGQQQQALTAPGRTTTR